jgi:flagellar FliJ protein
MRPVHRIAENNEKIAGRRAMESEQALAAQEARLRELRDYRDQYARRFESAGCLDAFRMHDYRTFLARLNDAIQQQQQVVEQVRSRHRQTQEEWLASRTHTQAVDKLIQRFREEERVSERRREQRVSDERAILTRDTSDKT